MNNIVYILIGAGVALLIFIGRIIARNISSRKEAALIQQRNAEKAEAERRAKARMEEERQRARAREEEERRRQAAKAKAEQDARQCFLREDPLAVKYTVPPPVDLSMETISESEFWKLSRYVFFDFETTGLDSQEDEIVELAAARVIDGQITDTFQELVNPGFPMPAEATAVNHITQAMLNGKPPIYRVLPSFLDFLGDDVIVAYNVSFDAKFLMQACGVNNLRIPEKAFDAMSLSRHWPEASNRKLISLLTAAGIQTTQTHRAMDDVTASVAMIQATKKRIEEDKQARKAEVARAKEEALAAEISDDDRRMYGVRCSLDSVLNQGSVDQGFTMGSPFYYQGEQMRKAGRLEDAIILFNKARYFGYDAPALYDSYCKAYRKMGNPACELEMIDEFLSRKTYGKESAFVERRSKVVELLNKQGS